MHRTIRLLPKKKDVWFENTEYDKIFSQNDTLYYLRKMKDERRRNIRFNVKEGMYSVVKSLAPQICRILNINSNGMAFEYFINNEDTELKDNKLDVVVKGSGFCLENIFFEKIYEHRIMPTDSCGLEKRIANIKFIDTDKTEIAKINKFIRIFSNKTMNYNL